MYYVQNSVFLIGDIVSAQKAELGAVASYFAAVEHLFGALLLCAQYIVINALDPCE